MKNFNIYDTLTKITITMFSAFLLFYFLISVQTGTCRANLPEEQAFYNMARNRFATASREYLIYIWHHDCHRRCFYQLSEQVEISCTYDPYVARPRRSIPDHFNMTSGQISQNHPKKKPKTKKIDKMDKSKTDISPFLSKKDASKFLRDQNSSDGPKSRKKRGIMDECCLQKACSWEEYAEYCHRTPRTGAAMANSCSYS